MAEMLKGDVIMDVVNVEQARMAADAGAVAVALLDADAPWLVSSVRMSVPLTHVDGVEVKRDLVLTEQFSAFLLNRG